MSARCVVLGTILGLVLETSWSAPATVRCDASEWTVASGTRPTKLPDATVHSGDPRWTVASATRRDHFGDHFGGHLGIILEVMLEVTLETCWSDAM